MTRTWFEWRLLLGTSITMAAFVVAVRILPFAAWRRHVRPQHGVRRADASFRVSASQIIRAINGASVVVPGGGNCLVRALTARSILARYGYAATLRFGVIKRAPGELRAHAWLECDGETLVGQYGKDAYAPLPDGSGVTAR
jgi:hypothetical protein